MTAYLKEEDNFETYLLKHPFTGIPESLYAPMNYIMQLGGKRMRPKLLIMAYESCGGQQKEDANKLALAIETFHNFSLVHDDIMDNAHLRRGQKTVHEKWNTATAILAGDNLLTKCYDLILNTNVANKETLLKLFTNTATQVCEGQQLDMDLPNQSHVTEAEYLEMIKYKTAVLPAVALQMGALAANSTNEVAASFYQYGLNLGMAFQLQDDYLDTFGTTEAIGKQVGGDILENKKTVLYLHALNHLLGASKQQLENWFTQTAQDNTLKIEQVKALYQMANSDTYLLNMKAEYEAKALEHLANTGLNEAHKSIFIALFDLIKNRQN